MEQEKHLVCDFTEPLTLNELIGIRNKLEEGPLRTELTEAINKIQEPTINHIAHLRQR